MAGEYYRGTYNYHPVYQTIFGIKVIWALYCSCVVLMADCTQFIYIWFSTSFQCNKCQAGNIYHVYHVTNRKQSARYLYIENDKNNKTKFFWIIGEFGPMQLQYFMPACWLKTFDILELKPTIR
jgi:hypothetical protein